MGALERMGYRPPAKQVAETAGRQNISAMAGDIAEFYSMDDPALLEFMRTGETGATITVKQAMRNPAVYRSVTLISYAMGMLPVHLQDRETKDKVTDHPLYPLLHRQPNNWQTAFNFRQLMQRRALVNGDGYAHIVRSGRRIIRLIPLDPVRVTPRQRNDWSVEYVYRREQGGETVLPPDQVLHVFGDSDDGLSGISLVKVAAETIGLALDAQRAASRLFKNGVMAGGAFTHPGKLSPEARAHLDASLVDRHSGAENAHKWLLLEEGMEPKEFSQSSRDSQQHETRKMQVEEIGRVFGLPRPMLGMDETTWGSGIGEYGQLLVRYGLNPWFTAWEQAFERSCLDDRDRERLIVKFNPGALIRGSLKDQAEFFSKALGAGGHQPWMDYDEVRDMQDLPERDIAPNPMTQPTTGATDEPAPTSEN